MASKPEQSTCRGLEVVVRALVLLGLGMMAYSVVGLLYSQTTSSDIFTTAFAQQPSESLGKMTKLDRRCKKACKGREYNDLGAEGHLLCYTFWHFHYGEEDGDYNIIWNPSPYASNRCLEALKKSKINLDREVCRLCTNRTDIEAAFNSKHPRNPSRGVVYTGSVRHLVVLYVSIAMLRKLDPVIPIEVFIEKKDLKKCLGMFQGYNVSCRAHNGHYAKYTNKLEAIINSHFDQVLFIDADNVLRIPPAKLFDSPEMRSTGAVFWPDLFGHACVHPTLRDTTLGPHDTKEENQNSPKSMTYKRRALAGQSTWKDHAIWMYTDVEWQAEWKLAQEFESGQLLIDKRRHLLPLYLARYLAGDLFAQNVLYGDKDCFRFAWNMLEADLTLVHEPPAQLGKMVDKEFHRTTLLQRFQGDISFVHQNKLPFPDQEWKLIIPKEGYRWLNSSRFDYSYCPPEYDRFRINDNEFSITDGNQLESFRQAWNTHFKIAQQRLSELLIIRVRS
ncbi:hypothetical protein AAMO2058_000626400 [Amorphochlora amoebiformis]